MTWKVIVTKRAGKELSRLPRLIREIFAQLVNDFEEEGPSPYGWDSTPLKNKERAFRVRLTREYRAVIDVRKPNIIVIRLAHRKEAYK